MVADVDDRAIPNPDSGLGAAVEEGLNSNVDEKRHPKLKNFRAGKL